MLDWISKIRRDRKRRDAHEQELKRTLANKVSKYEYSAETTDNEFTEITIDGKKLRITKEHITLNDLWPEPDIKLPS